MSTQPCAVGTRVRFFQRHRGLTPDTHGEGTFLGVLSSIPGYDNWYVLDDAGQQWHLIEPWGDTMEPIGA